MLYRSCTLLTILGYIAGYLDGHAGKAAFSPWFSPKYRYQLSGFRPPGPMEQIMRDADFGGELREFNGQAGRVRLLINFSPTVAISRP